MAIEIRPEPVIYTGGTFDLFHAGHVAFLKRCSELGRVVVSLNSDEFIVQYKGAVPIMNYHERKSVLESCSFVSEVVENAGGRDSKVAIEIVAPDYVVIGSDWATRDYYAQMQFSQEWLDARGIGLIYIPYTKGVSSSEIKNRIKIN